MNPAELGLSQGSSTCETQVCRVGQHTSTLNKSFPAVIYSGY